MISGMINGMYCKYLVLHLTNLIFKSAANLGKAFSQNHLKSSIKLRKYYIF